MKRKKFREEKVISILKEHEEPAPRCLIWLVVTASPRTRSTGWKARFGGMDVSDAKKLRALEQENQKQYCDRGNRVAQGSRNCARERQEDPSWDPSGADCEDIRHYATVSGSLNARCSR